jgi:hypothetical protein
MQELFASLQLTNKPEPRANFVERLPIELWIKVASHIGDLERFHPSRSGFYVPRDSPGHNTATIRALSATSNFFFNVCLPMRYYDMALCGSEWSREGYREGLTPHFTTILDDHRVTPHIRTLIWVGSAEPESVPPLALATLFNLRFLDLHPDITTAALYGVIFTLPNLTHLVLHDLPYAINLAESVDSSNLAFLRLQLDSGIEHGYPFLDSLHRFSKLRELQLLSRTAAQILDCFMSNGRPALRLDSLAIIGHTMRWQTNDYQFFYKYLMQHGSSLRTLFISHLSGRLPPDVGGALPSLRTYRGSMAFAQSCLAPCVEEILFTAYSGLPPVDPFTIIFSNNVSPSSLRRLEMPAPSFSLNAVSLDSILGHFPNLELLIFGDMKNPEGGPGAYVRGFLSYH